MIDHNDNNKDTDLWNYVIKNTKKIYTNNKINDDKSKLRTKKSEIGLTAEIKPKRLLSVSSSYPTVGPIHFSKENNVSGLSKRNINEIKKGKFKIQSKLDLHGYRLKESETLFFEFVKNNFYLKKRNILVISGKGEHGKGKIKHSIPIWITSQSLSPLIYFYSFAAPKDGGNGAYYIRLRKNKGV